jgi:hypothetical protein
MRKIYSLVFTLVILFFSETGMAQAPTLGTAANFVLFTTVGAVTNTGPSQITGNVGTNSGSTTGFGNVNGQMHDNDGVTAAAAADLLTAYNLLNATIPTKFPAPLLGNGATLKAGVYSISAVTTLSGTLNLNAQNVGSAVFIFKIGAAFASTVDAKIVLMNGAVACNVFWQIEGEVNLGSNNNFKGNIVAHNGAIHMTTTDTLEGRALVLNGEITTNSDFAYTPTGCGSPIHLGPAAPTLGTAGCFALFSGVGSVTNSGITKVTGDIGTNVGLTTGFNALDVNGMIHPIPDGATAAAAASLLNAYNYLDLLPVDIELLYPAQFGNDLVLTPHTYLMNAAASFTGNIILNAEGNSNAVFVIKVKGAFSTSTAARVKLINGTQGANVYWNINGAVTVQTNSIINGTLIVKDAAINFMTGDSLYGRALTTNGEFTTAATKAINPTGVCSGPVPVTWLSFSAIKESESVLLQWTTTNETNNDHYTVQKSYDGINYKAIATVAPQHNLSNSYSYTDAGIVKQNVFYRLNQVDKDGVTKYSKVVLVQGTRLTWSMFPNPATDFTTIQIPGGMTKGSVSIFDNLGKMVYSKIFLSAPVGESLSISLKSLSPGIYMVKVVSDNNFSTNKLVIQ